MAQHRGFSSQRHLVPRFLAEFTNTVLGYLKPLSLFIGFCWLSAACLIMLIPRNQATIGNVELSRLELSSKIITRICYCLDFR